MGLSSAQCFLWLTQVDWMTDSDWLTQLADRRPFAEDSVHDVESWRRFVVESDKIVPALFSRSEFDQLSALERQRYATARRQHHSGFGPIVSRTMQRIHQQLGALAVDNLDAPRGARSGAIVDGAGTLGKTTILTQLGKKYEVAMRSRFDDYGNAHQVSRFIPVVYAYVPSSTTPKKMLTSLVEFYGVPISSRDTEATILRRLRDTARSCGTSLVILDDIHNLHAGNKSAASVNDLLKELMDKIPATFVYAGINTRESILMLDEVTRGPSRASQTQNRYAIYDVRPFPYDVVDEHSTWLEIIRSIESHLLLVDHKAGSLEQLHFYLYARTAGGIGALVSLLRRSANLAITQGTEAATMAVMDEIQLADGPTRFMRRVKREIVAIKDDPFERRSFLEELAGAAVKP